ncbi:MAG: DUF308 domain-containing protein [Rhodomicrobium sp.]
MTSPSVNREEFERAVRRSLKDHWGLFTAQGVLLVLLGALAIGVPALASVAFSAFIGWLLFFAGGMRAVSLIRAPHAPGYRSSLLIAILTAILGIVLALFPIEGAVTLTMLLTVYFIVHGAGSFAFAFSIKDDTGRWVLLIFSGLIDLVLAGLVIAGWPSTGIWALGLYVGINMMLTGFALIFAALGARSA